MSAKVMEALRAFERKEWELSQYPVSENYSELEIRQEAMAAALEAADKARGGEVVAFGHFYTEDATLPYAGSGFVLGPKPPENSASIIPLYTHPADGVDLEQFRSLARWVMNSAGHGINDAQRRQGERLMALIDQHSKGRSDG